jgi:hypothetical protein
MLSMLTFVGALFAGVLSGIEVAIHYVVHPSVLVLGDPSQLRLRQALIRRLRVLAPACFLPMLAATIATAVHGGEAPTGWIRWTGVGAAFVWTGLRVVGTVPVNSATLAWNADSPPADWRTRVTDAERFHVVGVWAAIVAFLCALASAAA